MKLTRTSWAILAAAALLALIPAGRAQTNTPPRAGRQGNRGAAVDTQLTRLTEQLTLTDEQKPKVKAVLEDQNRKLAELRNDTQEDRRTKMQAIREEESKKMKEILTADQFKKYEELQQQRGRNGAAGGNRQGGARRGGRAGGGAGGAGGQQ